MRPQLISVLLAAALAPAACGGGSGDPWSVNASAQSANLTTPGSGSATPDGHTVTLAGGDSVTTGCSGAQYGFSNSPCNVVASANDIRGTYTFDWAYSTKDTSGAGADIFGYVADGKVVNLSDQGGALSQSGRVELTTSGSLSFFINCTDCTGGAAQATVTNFNPK